ncbi:hypothetical protein DFQ28_002414 [Apophysomyces sp. BC1034]|nr:hypothetical protein DFQ30_003820 [Apophysomyces sp. BC1015]KAG0179677.1 hypothetical protein DFQ29_001813 [Apophysomyces sp. BC1021]KAG0190166.1 hypothetical protein DFQ28_002414 [Apophysomyces sp. BC1034]
MVSRVSRFWLSNITSRITCRSLHHTARRPKDVFLWDKLPGEGGEISKGVEKLLGPMRARNFAGNEQAAVAGEEHFDVVIVGGGIVGLATARELLNRYQGMTVAVLEKEPEVATHQTGHNSGVIHAGLYYAPGSRMAQTCVHGADLMYQYCEEHGLPVERCGKFIVATNKAEHAQVERLYKTGLANGAKDLEIIYHDQISQMEPNVEAYSALNSPNTGIVNFWLVSKSLAEDIRKTGRGDIKLSFEARKFAKTPEGRIKISGTESTLNGPLLKVVAKNVITCGGFYSDRLSGLTGGNPNTSRVVTFRGTYYQMKPQYKNIVSRNIYPVPNSGGIPVGVHFTPTVDVRRGHQLIVGPGACLAFSREGYRFFDFNFRDMFDTVINPEFFQFLMKNFSLSINELYHDLSKRAFLKSGQKLIPSLTAEMVEPSFSGVMSQVFENGGAAASDLIVERNVMGGSILNLRNAPSPAATGSLAIGEMLVDIAEKDFGWRK